MEKILPVYGMAAAVMLAAIFLALRSNGSLLHKWAKIRLRTDENRHKGFHEPHEEGFEPDHTLEWLILGAILLLLCMLLSKV